MIELVERHVMPAVYDILPPRMQDQRATALLLAIGLQESRFLDRRQLAGGLARGFWQFEPAGILGVLQHEQSKSSAREALRRLRYGAGEPEVTLVHGWIQHNDMLAGAFARLLLWTVPAPLPNAQDEDEGWRQYVSAWRPGKPHRETWPGFWGDAWARVLYSQRVTS